MAALSVAHHQSSTDSERDGVCGGPLFAPPSSLLECDRNAPVAAAADRVLGRGMCSNYHRRHFDYSLVPA